MGEAPLEVERSDVRGFDASETEARHAGQMLAAVISQAAT